MRLKSLIQTISEAINTVSKQDAINRGWFGPVYHGTTEVNMANILQNGFRIDPSLRMNGYRLGNYGDSGIPSPQDHLGYGVYFTTVKNIAKKYNRDTTKGIREFYLDVPRLETINFASERTMMKWWIANGYDFQWEQTPPESPSGAYSGDSYHYALKERQRATQHLTEVLASKYDAVWYKGKTMYKVLDGDQICVYDPSRIYMVDANLSKAMDIGSKVVYTGETNLEYPGGIQASFGDVGTHGGRWVLNQNGSAYKWTPAMGARGIIVGKRPINPEHRQYLPVRDQNRAEFRYTVKWAKGGTQGEYFDGELAPA